MLNFSKWKAGTIIAVCLIGTLLSLPNFFPASFVAQWPSFVPRQQVTLGLDLQGGAHYVLEVDVKGVQQELLNTMTDSIRVELRKENIGYRDIGVDNNSVTVTLREPGNAAKAEEIIRRSERGAQTAVESGVIRVTYTDQFLRDRRTEIVNQAIEVIRRRIDETGTKEPTVQRQGDDRILIQIPGPAIDETILLKTAKLEFRLVNENVTASDIATRNVPANTELIDNQERDAPGGLKLPVFKRVVVGGESLLDAHPANDQGRWVISFRFDGPGGRRFCDATKENVGKRLAIKLDNKIISAPVIQGSICGGSGIITGSFTAQSAADLALLLRAGALPANLTFIEKRTVGADLGADSIRAGAIASVIGSILVVLFMVVCYGFFGLVANFALIFNVVLILACMTLLGSSLSLPGIAGIVLTIGMAVDANVLIYERIREEIRNGRTAVSSMEAGYERAMSAIIDGNLTTLIAGLILLIFGAGPVRGFAVTLSLGLVTSMFTSILVTRLIFSWWLRRKRPKTLNI